MDRYISVPKNYAANGDIKEAVENLARLFSLEIREEDCQEVSIVSKPKVKEISYMDTYSKGKIWSLNIHDEFVNMDGGCFVDVDGEIFYPKIKEKHIAKFRLRHLGSKEKSFHVYINGISYFLGKITEK